MRVLTALIALVATPFIISAAQDPHRTTARPDKIDKAQCVQQGQQEGDDCVLVPPPPPNSAEIHGLVFGDANANGILDPGELGIEGWLVSITGPVNATLATDVLGNFSFTGLAAGTYTVCEASKFPYMFETLPTSGPACPFGFGYTVTLADGQVVTGLVFGNL
jgi:SdrD B-like domain